MAEAEIRFNLTRTDLRIFLEHSHALRRGRGGSALLWTSVAAGGLAGLGVHMLHEEEYPGWETLELFLVAALFAMSYFALIIWQRFGKADRWLEQFAGNYGIVPTPAGLSVSRPERRSFIAWPDIRAFEETSEYWYFHSDAGSGIIVPKAAFSEPAAGEEFAWQVRTFWTEHPDNRGRRLPGHPLPSASRRVLANLWANLRAGYRFVMFRPAEARDFTADAMQLALLLALQALLYGAMDFFAAGPEPRFNAYGVSHYGMSAVLFLLSGAAIGGLLPGTGNLLRLLVVAAAAELIWSAVYFLFYAGIDGADPGSRGSILIGFYLVWIVWNLSLMFRAVVAVYGCPRAAALLPVSVFALFNLVLADALPDQNLFYPAPDDAGQLAEGPDIDGEDVFYRQPKLLDEAAGRLAAGRPGVTDLYFVGFAGQADERVFAHEVEYVRDLFDRRFGTAGRSVALVNSADTADRLPIANGHNLDTMLQAVAKRMNRDEDVLFLFLTSHGSRDHRLSVRFSSLPLNDLPAAKLKELLDRSGIRNRVIVVSACYSGGFLDVLKDDNSLILTAASRDRTSFGCGTESDFTYFGEAYFVQALKDTRSFIEAFGQARLLIEQREKGEGKKPSMPQLHVGGGIMPKLRELEARVAASL
jgi:hypothetical protein